MIELYELNPHKMTTPQEKAQCISWFIETKSDVQTLLTISISIFYFCSATIKQKEINKHIVIAEEEKGRSILY